MSQAQRILPNSQETPFRSTEPGLFKRLVRLPGQHPIGMIGVVIITLVVLVAVSAPFIAPYGPTAQVSKRLLDPSAQHLLGTDEIGRDVFSRIIFGSRVSLYVGIIAVTLALSLGATTGIISGYMGGTFDNLVMRLVDLLFAFPGLVLAIVIAGLLGPSISNTMIAIGIVYAPQYARVSRSSVLSVKEELYIEAARTVGGRGTHIVIRHILPNIVAPLIVLTTLSMSTAILTEAALSFLGLGTQPPDPSWGAMLSTGRRYMEIAPWVAIFPGLAIMFAVLGFNLLGDGLRDALDPRLRE
jgi:peptide/nickel transport system permease protein